MAFTDLLSTSFLFSVAIIIILIGGIFAYVSYRMSEQDHKISSMVGLISTMAEELQFFRSKLSQTQSAGQILLPEETSEHIHRIPILDPNNLITRATSLIPVSDDEDDDDDEDLESESESESEDGDGDEDGDEDGEGDEFELDEVVDLEETLQLENPSQILTSNINDIDENYEKSDEIKSSDIKSIHLEEPIELNVFSHGEHEHDHDHSLDILASDLKTISITDLEDTNKKTDYKKLAINKLREIVIEKGIVADASKLKKSDLLKLLGDE
jgi:hypothetical protein